MKSPPLVVATGFCVALACCTQDITPHVAEMKNRDLGLSAENAPLVASAWWNAFGDPQLDHLVALALANSPTLEQARARLRAALSEVDGARSQEFPQVSLDGLELRDRLSDRFLIPPTYGGTWQWIGAFGATLSWDLDLWGRQAALVSKARDLGGAAKLDIDAADLAIEGALVNAYIGLDEAYILADVADETVAQREHIVALSARRERDGLDSREELIQAQTLLDSARKNAKRAHGNCEVATHVVAALTGQGANIYSSIRRPVLSKILVLPLPRTLPADLLARRPDILAARLRIDAAMKGREAAHAAFYPDVNLLGIAGFVALGLGDLFTAQAAQYGGGPAFHLPIFDAGKLRSDYESATADLDSSVADYNASVISAVRDAADLLTQIRSLDAQNIQQVRFGQDAQNGYDLAETRYRTGLANQLTVLNAEDLLLQAREQQAEIDAGRSSERVNLVLAIGGDFGGAQTEPKLANAEKGP